MPVTEHEHGRAEVLEDVHVPRAEPRRDPFREGDAIALHHEVDVLAGPPDQPVAYIATDREGRGMPCCAASAATAANNGSPTTPSKAVGVDGVGGVAHERR